MSITFLPVNIFIADPTYLRDYLCHLCQNVLYNCVNDTFGHVFCASCIDDSLLKTSVCPYEHHVISREQLRPTIHIRNFLNKQRVRCFYFLDGCSWESELSSLDSHLAECVLSPKEEAKVKIEDDDTESKHPEKSNKKEYSESEADIKSMSSEGVENKPKPVSLMTPEVVVKRDHAAINGIPKKQEVEIKGLEEIVTSCQRATQRYKERMEELALQYENKAKAEKALLNAIELKIDALHKKIDSLQTLPKTELLEKKRSASESSDKDITAYYCSKDVKMEGRNIKCINQPEDTHAFCLLDWEGNRSFKAVFKIITKVTWLAFGTVDLKVFERQKKSFRSKTHKHGFNLITSEGYIFKTGGDTTSSDSFKALKKGDTVTLEYCRETQVLSLETSHSKAKIEGVSREAESAVCILFTEEGMAVDILSIE